MQAGCDDSNEVENGVTLLSEGKKGETVQWNDRNGKSSDWIR